MRQNVVAANVPKTQMSGRYPQTVAEEAHDYAIAHGFSLNALLSMALAEYLAKRRESGAVPAPQLHYRKGHPPAELVQLQHQLMQRDPRGRKLTERCSRVTSAGSETTTVHGVTMRAPQHVAAPDADQRSPRARADCTASDEAGST